jgi:ABC-type transport system involved in cytochrome bd biosynthesis fused ATPase/permease subunit
MQEIDTGSFDRLDQIFSDYLKSKYPDSPETASKLAELSKKYFPKCNTQTNDYTTTDAPGITNNTPRSTSTFEEGLVGIIGRNGAGKSTIFEAIFFTAFLARTRAGHKEFCPLHVCCRPDKAPVELKLSVR